jgi:hypothetical protein
VKRQLDSRHPDFHAAWQEVRSVLGRCIPRYTSVLAASSYAELLHAFGEVMGEVHDALQAIKAKYSSAIAQRPSSDHDLVLARQLAAQIKAAQTSVQIAQDGDAGPSSAAQQASTSGCHQDQHAFRSLRPRTLASLASRESASANAVRLLCVAGDGCSYCRRCW